MGDPDGPLSCWVLEDTVRLLLHLSLVTFLWFCGTETNQSMSAVGLLAEAAHSAHDEHGSSGAEQWEGSAAGKAYSERNHGVAALFLLLIGWCEFRAGWGSVPKWMKVLLPASLMGTGLFLLIWSDHEAWPIGRLSFVETFSGVDPEIFQHKLFALLSLIIGGIEGGRQLGRLTGRIWSIPLPLYAIAGGLLLLSHEHGPHPAAQQIAQHHALMAVFATTAGIAKLLAVGAERGPIGTSKRATSRTGPQSPWTMAWGGLVFALGILLLFYRE